MKTHTTKTGATYSTMTQGRLSALKAWETRRKNAISLRQRRAARKAWKTRHANGK